MAGYGVEPRVKNGPALAGYGAEATRAAIAATIITLPEQLRRSLTWDRGKELAQHRTTKPRSVEQPLDKWCWCGVARRESAFWIGRIGSVEVLIGPIPEGTGSEATSCVVAGHASRSMTRTWCRCAGLVPVMALAEQAGLSQLIGEQVRFRSDAGRVGGGEPGREADLDHRRDGCGRGQHRRSGRDPLRWDEAAVR